MQNSFVVNRFLLRCVGLSNSAQLSFSVTAAVSVGAKVINPRTADLSPPQPLNRKIIKPNLASVTQITSRSLSSKRVKMVSARTLVGNFCVLLTFSLTFAEQIDGNRTSWAPPASPHCRMVASQGSRCNLQRVPLQGLQRSLWLHDPSGSTCWQDG